MYDYDICYEELRDCLTILTSFFFYLYMRLFFVPLLFFVIGVLRVMRTLRISLFLSAVVLIFIGHILVWIWI